MLKSPMLNRRQILMAGASMPLAAAAASPALAAAEMMGVATTNFNRVKLGDFEVTTLLVGSRVVENPQGIFGMNVSEAEFAEASAQANIPTNAARFYFTPTVVNTGSELILFDTGLNPGAMSGALESAGYSADQIDKVVITHMHGDHIGGVSNGGMVTFKNATHYAGSVEDNHWSGTGNERYEGKIRPILDHISFVDPGASVASGVTAVEAYGHTPGHMGYMIESGGKSLMICADFANHYVWSLGYPDWEVRFDMDKAAAAKTRRKMLDMMAADQIPFIGYHMPFPAIGYVETRGDGFEYQPATYQLSL